MNIIRTEIPDVVILEPRVFGDARGYFYESFSSERFRKEVCDTVFVQDNQSKSGYGVVRGLHYQTAPYCQGKLVRVVMGRIYDVVVDIRHGSPTFGEHVAVELSAENNRQLFIPRGFAHGFAVLSEEAVVLYKCDNYYKPECEGGIAWNDPALGIDWQLPAADVILSAKDADRWTLADAPKDFDINTPLY